MSCINNEVSCLSIVNSCGRINNGYTRFPGKIEYVEIVMNDDCLLQLGTKLTKYSGSVIFVIGVGSILIKVSDYTSAESKRELALSMYNLITEAKKKRPVREFSMLLDEIYNIATLQINGKL